MQTINQIQTNEFGMLDDHKMNHHTTGKKPYTADNNSLLKSQTAPRNFRQRAASTNVIVDPN
jgi:hypothetical protein